MTTTIEMTIAEKHRLLADLYAVDGLGTHIGGFTIESNWESVARLYVHPYNPAAGNARALLVAFDLLDDPRVEVHSTDGNEQPHVIGHYRGVDVHVMSVISDPAARDLIRSMEPTRAMLAALAGDPVQPEQPKPLISQSTIDEIRDMGIRDAHQIHEAICSCGWVSNEAYGDATTASLEGYEHVKKMIADAKAADTTKVA